MKKYFAILLFALCALTGGMAQVPLAVRSVSSLPATCHGGSATQASDKVMLVSGGVGVGYTCTAANTWTKDGTVTGITITVPTGLNISPASLYTSGTINLTWSGLIPNASINWAAPSDIGTGTAGQGFFTNLSASGTFTTGAGSAACGSSTGCWGTVAGLASGLASTAGAGAIQLDSVSGTYWVILPSGSAFQSLLNYSTVNLGSTAVGGISGTLGYTHGGSGTASLLAGIVRGGNPFTASEISGDATTSGSNVLTLATVNSNVGTCGDATHVGQVTLNAKGLTTACTAVSISGAGGGLGDPGSNGLVKRTALNTTTVSTSTDIVGLFTSCSGTQYLGADGECHTASSGGGGSGSGSFSSTGVGISLTTSTAYQPINGNYSSVITTEANADGAVGASTASVSSLTVALGTALGGSQTLTVTLRDTTAGADEAVTCQVPNGGQTCTDLTHSYNIPANHLVVWKMVLNTSTLTSNIAIGAVVGSPATTACYVHYFPTLPLSDTLSAAGTFATTLSATTSCIGAGSVLHIQASGVYTTTGTASPKFTIQINAGGTTGICPYSVSTTNLSLSQTNGPWTADCYIQINSTGSSGTASVWGMAWWSASNNSTGGYVTYPYSSDAGTNSLLAFDTTGTKTISVQAVTAFVSGQTFKLLSLDATVTQ